MTLMPNSRETGEPVTPDSTPSQAEPVWVAVLPHRWVARSGDAVAGRIDLTAAGRYRAYDGTGRNLGTFANLDEAREAADSRRAGGFGTQGASARALSAIGLVLFLVAAAAGAWGIVLLLPH